MHYREAHDVEFWVLASPIFGRPLVRYRFRNREVFDFDSFGSFDDAIGAVEAAAGVLASPDNVTRKRPLRREDVEGLLTYAR